MGRKLCRILLLAFVLRLFLIFSRSHIDIVNHVDWGIKFWEYGPKYFYEKSIWGLSWPNQPLGSILLFAAIAKIYSGLFNFLWQLNLKFAAFPSFIFPFLEKKLHLALLKLPFALSDLGIGVLLYRIVKDLVKKEKPALLATSIFLFNPALFYNSVVWGQTESLINLLALLGLWFFWKEKFFWGWLAYFGSLYFKLSLIIFAPLFILIIWQRLLSSPRRSPFGHLRGVLRLLVPLIGVAAIFLLISLPFVHHGNVFTWIWYLYTNRVLPRQGEMLSGNAFNLWTLLYGIDLGLKESLSFLGSTAKFWGRVFFLIPSIWATIAVFKKKKQGFPDYLWLGVIYAFSAFLFMTNMHERYLYPVFPLLAILVVRKKTLLKFFVILSLIQLINLYNLWYYPRLGFLVSTLTAFDELLPRLFSLANLSLFFLILRSIPRHLRRGTTQNRIPKDSRPLVAARGLKRGQEKP